MGTTESKRRERSKDGRFLSGEDGKRKTRRSGAKAKGRKTSAKKRAAPKNCKKYAKTAVRKDWPEIVDTLVKSAKRGSYNHTKLLVEVSGIKDEPVEAEPEGKRESVAKLLLEKLMEKSPETAEQKTGTKG